MKIIAEIGWNHMGDMDLALRMTEAAARSGADIVKFQTWKVENLKSGPWDSDGRRQIYEKAELSREMHRQLKQRCEDLSVKFMSSCFSARDVAEVRAHTNLLKIPSTEIANRELLEEAVRLFVDDPGHHIYLSTGASTWAEVETASSALIRSGANFTLMHCVSSYPCPADKCNMLRMKDLQRLSASVGYSGHYPGTTDALVAVELGAVAVEKHFTVDNSLPGRDNKFAILPHELAQIREYADAREKMLTMMGSDFQSCEDDMRKNYRGRWDKRE